MQHKISAMCSKIDLIKKKSDMIRDYHNNYGSNQKIKISYMISDLQQLCRDVGMDIESIEER